MFWISLETDSSGASAEMVDVSKGTGLAAYYKTKIEELELQIRDKTHNLRRLEAQRNELNTHVRMLREELQLLQEPGSYVGEVIKVGLGSLYMCSLLPAVTLRLFYCAG